MATMLFQRTIAIYEHKLDHQDINCQIEF